MPETPRYITDRQAESMGLDPETAATVAEDAATVYEHVNRSKHNSRDDLIRWANGLWGESAVDRLNAALDFLTQAGRLILVP